MGEMMNRLPRIILLSTFAVLALVILLACRLLIPQGETPEVHSPAGAPTTIHTQPLPSITLPEQAPAGTLVLSTQAAPTVTGAVPGSPVAPVPTSSEKGGQFPAAPTAPQAVILVAPDDVLNVRRVPGPDAQIISELPPDATGISPTGAESEVDDQTWVEIRTSSGTGWVNARYLTEYKSAGQFCNDPAVTGLIANFKAAVSSRDGNRLAAMVSPAHGLYLNYLHTGNRVPYSPEEVKSLFTSQAPVNWGTHPASGLDVTGTFAAEVMPKLEEVLNADYETHCNDPALEPSNYVLQWPVDYKNINYIALAKPGTPGTELDWRTWLVGVEYVDGVPYLFALLQLFWEP